MSRISISHKRSLQDRSDVRGLPALRAESPSPQWRDSTDARLNAFFDHCPDCVKILRRNGTILEVNAAGMRLFEGDFAEQVVGKSMFDFVAPEDRYRFQAMHERVCNGQSATLEFQLIGRKGARRHMETFSSPIPDPAQGGFLHLAIARDVSERHEGDLTNRRLSAIIEYSDDAIISKDLNGTIMTWNKGAEHIFGYSAEEAIGRPVTMLIPEDRPNEEPEILNRIRQGERIDHYETIRRRKDGSLLNISLTVSPIKDAEGHVVGASKIARDITARKRAEQELRVSRAELARLNDELEMRVSQRTASLTEAIAQMEEFSYTLSHDLRAPARAMTGYARIILDDFSASLNAEAKEFLDRIIRSGERMDELIQDVLTYSRLSRREVQLSPVNLDKLVADIVQQYPEMQAPLAHVSVRSPLLNVQAHEPSLVQAVSNLLANAVKFVAPAIAPRVIVRTEPRGDNVRLWVEDNGIGIKPDHQHRIFGVFERLPTTFTYEGTGIGLAIVRKAAEKMNGSCGVESDGQTGSRFWLELPAGKAQ